MKTLLHSLYTLLLLIPFGLLGQTVNTTPVNLVGSSDPIPGPGGFIDHPFTPSPLTGTYHGGVVYGGGVGVQETWGYEISDLTIGEEYVLTVYYMFDRVFGTPLYDRFANLSMLSGAALDFTLIPYVPEPDWRNWYTMTVRFTALDVTDRIDIQTAGVSDNSLWLFTDMAIDGAGDCDNLLVDVSAREICIGEEITLTATSVNDGIITWDGGLINGEAFEPLAAGTFTFNTTSDHADDCDYSIEIIVHDLPDVSASADNTTICIGDDVTLNGGGADTYVWDFGVLDGVAFAPVTTETYTVIGTDINGCVNTNNILVDVVALPIIDAGIALAVCEGEPVTLNGTGAGVGGTYDWDGGIADGIAFTPLATTVYTVTGTDENGCENSDNVTVTVNPLPVIDAGPNDAICIGESYTLVGTGFGISDVIAWDSGVINGVSFEPTTTETYYFTATSAEGCTSVDEVTITVNPLPIIDFYADDTVGCEPFTVRFTNAITDETLYAWDFGDGEVGVGASVEHTYSEVGLFDVRLTVTSTEGCVNSDTYANYIEVVPVPVAHFTFIPVDETEFNYSYNFHNSSTDATNYSWAFGDGSILEGEEHPTHTYPQVANGNYHIVLTAINDFGCISTYRENLSITKELIYYIPNAFTPDGDTFNETFKPIFTRGLDIYDYHMTVFNRWGEMVFESYDAAKGWDGSYGNQGLVDDGTYVWMIKFGEGMSDKKHIEEGTVTILK
ncbi:T9SS C-terminal target domain-containing protein [Crocinitomix catalasitica]|uniref:T9SS C-terminal target domain-containing protein n=1 Tax=Crocinitomix catalasitica TaxID=184607 RepID=UPI000482A574|nr:T9SS C-terminal target domain-containing protein [Crocinitomix catalasitica]